MTYMVTGGTGALGHFLVRELVEHGERPVVLTASGDTSLIRDVANRCSVVRADVENLELVEDLIRRHRVSRIAHLASPLFDPGGSSPPVFFTKAIAGTANILEAASRNGVERVVYASSKAVYGKTEGRYGHPAYSAIREDQGNDPTTLYGILKLTSENLARWYKSSRNLSVASLRFATTVGPGKLKRHRGDTALLSALIENAMLGRLTRIDQGAESATDIIFNGDVAKAILMALRANELFHSEFNICTGKSTSMTDYVAAIRKFYPGCQIRIGPGPKMSDVDAMHCVLDGSRAGRELGFHVEASAEDLVHRYIHSMNRMGLEPTPT